MLMKPRKDLPVDQWQPQVIKYLFTVEVELGLGLDIVLETEKRGMGSRGTDKRQR